jgi:hypothetical protein
MAKIQLHRNGVLAVLGIVLLVGLVGAVWAVAILRVISVLVVIVAFIEIVMHLVRRGDVRIQSRLFDSQSTFNAIRKPRK